VQGLTCPAVIGHNILVMSESRPVGRKRRKTRPPQVRETGPFLAAADFKARCLELMDRVSETGAEYTITKHGRPVARLVACEPSGNVRGLFGSMKGTVLAFDRPLDPIDGSYDVNRD
jgi:prevent-host-death family protein